MYLYLVQHADALKKEEDPDRGLSEKGIENIHKTAAFAKGLNITVSKILHSGKKRALQTAQILSDNITAEAGVMETDGIAPMDDPDIWLKRLSGMNEDVMLVGHLPHLAKLSAGILCDHAEKNVVDFETGSIVCLSRLEDSQWVLDWLIKPRLLG